eukprot:jgi/Mesen1/10211/ME000077S09548
MADLVKELHTYQGLMVSHQALRERMLQQEEVEQQQQKEALRKRSSVLARWFHRWAAQAHLHACLHHLRPLTARISGRRGRKVDTRASRMVARIRREKALDDAMRPPPAAPASPRGIYLYGNVGSGKTLLLNMLHEAAHDTLGACRRLHFHSAMLEVHARLHADWKQRQQLKSGQEKQEDEEDGGGGRQERMSVLDRVADGLMGMGPSDNATAAMRAPGACLLCFDELQVVDVFTAVALARLLPHLLARGAVLAFTSNRPPRELNKDGLQRTAFEECVEQLEARCRPLHVGSGIDYRRHLLPPPSSQSTYLWPLSESNDRTLDHMWRSVVRQRGDAVEISRHIPIMFGRTLRVPYSCSLQGGIARFSFEDLCKQPVGAADYIAVAAAFQTVFITHIPLMSMRIRDQARRFITLVDELYNQRCCLVCTAAAPPDQLFLGTEEGTLLDYESLQFETAVEGSRLRTNVTVDAGVAPLGATEREKEGIQSQLSGREEHFAFRRAESRLIEMQSHSYVAAHSKHHLVDVATGKNPVT